MFREFRKSSELGDRMELGDEGGEGVQDDTAYLSDTVNNATENGIVSNKLHRRKSTSDGGRGEWRLGESGILHHPGQPPTTRIIWPPNVMLKLNKLALT